MSKTIFLPLLLFCGILCQEIFATLSDQNTTLSSNFLVRKRRVTNHMPGGRISVRIEDARYMVRIRETNSAICAGAILSHYTVITAAQCIHDNFSYYQILSGVTVNNGYNLHNITSRSVHNGNPPHQPLDSIILVTVDPPFIFTPKTGSIALYVGPYLRAGTEVKVVGWGYIYPLRPRLETRQKLRCIFVPIMNHDECRASYSHQLNITDKNICTYHPDQHCAQNDEGAPLIFENKLVGIHILKEAYPGHLNPDIFINLQRPEYSEWIREHTFLM